MSSVVLMSLSVLSVFTASVHAQDVIFNVMQPNNVDSVLIADPADGVVLGRNIYGRNFNVAAMVGPNLAGMTVGSMVLTRVNTVTNEIISTTTETDAVCYLLHTNCDCSILL